MPQFKCPKCDRVGHIPMAYCDDVLIDLPFDFDREMFLIDCVDCETNSPTRHEPVKWYPPNIHHADKETQRGARSRE